MHQPVAHLDQFFRLFGIFIFIVHHQVPKSGDKTIYAVNSPIVPLGIQLRRAYKQFIQTQRITAVVSDQIVRRYDVALGFAHLNAVFPGNHPLVKQLDKRLVKIERADIVQKLCIESGIEQMQHRMLHAADIHIDRKELIRLLTADQLLVIFTVHIPQEIPGRSCPLRHCVSLTFGRLATFGTYRIDPVRNIRKRRLPGPRRLIGFHIRQ